MESGMDNVLCACSAYEQKFYYNNRFSAIPEVIRQELQIMCVLFTEEVGGEIYIGFDDEGNLFLSVNADEEDILYDEIGSGLKIKQLQIEKRELFEQLEEYYRSFFMK